MYPLAITVNVQNPEQFAALSALLTKGDVPAVIRPNRPQPATPATPASTPTQPSSDAGTTAAKPDTAQPAVSTPSSESTAPSQPAPSTPAASDPGEAYKALATEFKAFAGRDIATAKSIMAKYSIAKCTELKPDQYAAFIADVRAAAAPKQEASV